MDSYILENLTKAAYFLNFTIVFLNIMFFFIFIVLHINGYRQSPAPETFEKILLYHTHSL